MESQCLLGFLYTNKLEGCFVSHSQACNPRLLYISLMLTRTSKDAHHPRNIFKHVCTSYLSLYTSRCPFLWPSIWRRAMRVTLNVGTYFRGYHHFCILEAAKIITASTIKKPIHQVQLMLKDRVVPSPFLTWVRGLNDESKNIRPRPKSEMYQGHNGLIGVDSHDKCLWPKTSPSTQKTQSQQIMTPQVLILTH